MTKPKLDRLADFVSSVGVLLDSSREEDAVLPVVARLMAELVTVDDWLPDDYAAPDLVRPRQYLLHLDPKGRFSLVSSVWGPGQATPVHDHTVWGVVGIVRGAELSQRFKLDGGLRPCGEARRLEPGDVETVSPTRGDIHRVVNACDDRPSVSIHLYGADIGAVRRSIYDEHGATTPFVSGYADEPPIDLKPFGTTA